MALAAGDAKRFQERPETIMNPALLSHKSPHWRTPKRLYEELHREFNFTLDPCPIGEEELPLYGEGALSRSWKGERIFCNPPYGPKIGSFLSKAWEAELAVFLLPARTDTRWFHGVVLPFASEIRFLKGRLYFGNGSGPAPFPSMIVVFRKDGKRA